MAESEGRPVLLHVYDLSSGLAAQLSKALLGKQVKTLLDLLKGVMIEQHW